MPANRGGASKYDYVKVRVWLRDPRTTQDAAHYYVLSRFLVSRALAVTQMAYRDAIRLALELKKQLVDAQTFDLSQLEMEAALFSLMRASDYGGPYIRRFRMMSAFNQQRVPLVILVGGTGLIGKSTVATLLAERLNLPNILQTELLHSLLVSTHLTATVPPQPPPAATPPPPPLAGEAVPATPGTPTGAASPATLAPPTSAPGTPASPATPPSAPVASVAKGPAILPAATLPAILPAATLPAAAPPALDVCPGRLWSRRFGSEALLLAAFEREAAAVRGAAEAELHAVLTEGRRTILEARHRPHHRPRHRPRHCPRHCPRHPRLRSHLDPPQPPHPRPPPRPRPHHAPTPRTQGMHLDLTLYEEALCGGQGGGQSGGQAVVAPFILSLTPEDHAVMLRWSSPPTSASEDHAPLASRPPTPPPPPTPLPLLPPTRPATAPAAPLDHPAPPRLCDDHLCDAASAGTGAEGAEAEGAEGAPLSQRALLAQLGAIQQHLERRGEHLVVGIYCSKHISNTAPP